MTKRWLGLFCWAAGAVLTFAGSTVMGPPVVSVSNSIVSATNPALPLVRSQQTTGLPAAVDLPSPVTIAPNTAYNAFPALLRDRFGRLQCFYRSASSHTSTDGVVKRAVSPRGGIGWTTNTISGPNVVQDVHAIMLPTGRIILVYSETTAASNVWLLYSDDDGESWSTKVKIASAAVWNGTAGVICTDLLVTPKGTLLAGLYGHYHAGDAKFRAMVIRSTDNGVTWGAEAAVAGDGANADYNEIVLTALPGARTVGLVRDETSGKLWQSTSTDDGLTWSSSLVEVTPTGYVTSRPDIVTAGGITHMFYRGPSQTTRRAVSYDGMATWNSYEVVTSLGQGNGYSYSSTVIEGGLLVTALAVDTNGITNAEIRLQTYRLWATTGMDGALTPAPAGGGGGGGSSVYASVYHNTTQSVASGVPTILSFNSERADTSAIHSTSGNLSRLVAPQDGFYLIHFTGKFSPNTTGLRGVSLVVDTLTYIYDRAQVADASTSTQVEATRLYYLNQGEGVEVEVFQNCGSTLTIASAGDYTPEFTMALQ